MRRHLISYLSASLILTALDLPVRAQDLSAVLSVVTEPDKANVSFDGVLREQSPVTISHLRAGTHLLSIEKAGYTPVQKTVMLTAGQHSSLTVPLERVTGLVLLQSSPDGADIEINGANRGKAPLLLPDLPPGTYRAKGSLAGYLDRTVEFEVKDRVPLKVLVPLSSDSATLIVRTQPVGATVAVNGLTRGVTPCTLDRLPAGAAEVAISLSDYEVYRSAVKLQANEEQTIDVTLKAIPCGLTVISTPAGARVFVDEVLKGQSPVTVDSLAAGSHALRVESVGYETMSREVALKPAQKPVEEFQLVRNVGRLEVMVKPEGVQVSVDGAVSGTVMPGVDSAVASYAVEVPVGDHKVTLSLKGFAPIEKRVTIRKGETSTLKEVMKRAFVADTQIKLVSGEVLTGVLGERLPNNDLMIETQLGIYKTIKAADIASVDRLHSDK